MGIDRHAADLHIFHATRAADGNEISFRIDFDRRRHRRLDGVCQTGHLEERAVIRRKFARAHFERIQNLLPGDIAKRHPVSKRKDLHERPIRNRPLGKRRLQAARIDERDVGVIVFARRVGRHIAQIRFRVAHRPDAVQRVGEVDRRHAKLHRQLPLRFLFRFLQERRNCRLLFRLGKRVQKGRGHGAVIVQNHLSEALELRARLRDKHRFPVRILVLTDIDFVRMSVNHRIDAACRPHDRRAAPNGNRIARAEMPDQDDEIRAVCPRLVHRFLDGRIERRARLVLPETVHIVAVRILKKCRRGGNERLRRRHPDESDSFPVRFHRLASGKYRLSRREIREIRTEIPAGKLLRQLEETRHPVIKIVIAGRGKIVIGRGEERHHVLPFGKFPDGPALDGIAVLHQKDRRIFFRQIFFVLRDTG